MTAAIWGKLAFLIALLALALAFRSKNQVARSNGILLSVTILVGTLRYVLSISRLVGWVTILASLVLGVICVFRVVRTANV